MSVLAGESPENSPRDSKLCNDDLVKARDSLFAFMEQMDIRDSVKLEDLEDDSGDSDDSDDSAESEDSAEKSAMTTAKHVKSPILMKALKESRNQTESFHAPSPTVGPKPPAPKVRTAPRSANLEDRFPKLISDGKRPKEKKPQVSSWFACCAGERDDDDSDSTRPAPEFN